MNEGKRKIAFSGFFLLVSFYFLPSNFDLLQAQVQGQTSVDRASNQDQKTEADWLQEKGVQLFRSSQLRAALQTLEQVLAIRRNLEDRKGEGETLGLIGQVYNDLSQYPKALATLQQALRIRQELGDRKGKGETLTALGDVYINLGEYDAALAALQQALAIHQALGNRAGIGETLYNLGEVYNIQSQYDQALELLQQALAIRKEVGDRVGEGRTLHNIGFVYRKLGQYDRALDFYQQALQIVRTTGDRLGEGRSLSGIGGIYESRGQYSQALEVFQQALAILQAIGNRAGEGGNLNSLGRVYNQLGQYDRALEFYRQALAIAKEIGDKASEGTLLSNIGGLYHALAQYPKALEFYQQALAILKAINDQAGEGRILNNIGLVYNQLGQYNQALEFYQQALAIRKAIGDKAGEGNTLHNSGVVYEQMGQYSQALEFLQQALAIRQTIGDRAGAGTTLNSIGLVYDHLGQYERSAEFYQQALEILTALGNRAGVGLALNNIGLAYYRLGQYSKALEFLQQALAILKEIGDKAGEAQILSNIGSLLEQQNQPELAIAFYKQSVNVTETIRQDLRVLPQEQQESYTKTVADTYRYLANLLIAQGRILEAQQVLELLKNQELRDYTRNARAGGQTSGIALNTTEEQIIKQYGSLIAFGRQVDECKKTSCSQLSQLNQQLQAMTEQYNQTVQALKKPIGDRLAQDRAFLNPETLAGRKAKEIVESQPNTILIYPFVLEDKIWLLWASKGGIIKSIQVPVNRRQLGQAVVEFRQVVQDSNSGINEVQTAGKKLYDWLIKPLEPELKANKIQNLVFSLDQVTRYIPIGALFDGKQYLIENYSVSTVLSADLTDLRDRLPSGTQNTPVLALGLSNAVAGFNSLPNVPAELDAIVRNQPTDTQGIYPGTKFLNGAFDFATLRDNLIGKKILHIATHGDFVRGRPEESFLLLGTGEKLTIPQIETLQDLSDVHLVVLSACETALGGPDADGLEIAGISYYFLNRGAKAVMASLWQVSDRSTSLLMQNFYSNLANGNITKTAALRQAQLSLLKGNPSATASNQPQFAHPYYWAAFILIGNGL